MGKVRQLVDAVRLLAAQRRIAGELRATGLFDSSYYLVRYADVAPRGIDPVFHYVRYGVAERRNPSAEFDTRLYLLEHPEVDPALTNPLLHYARSGGRTRPARPAPTTTRTPQAGALEVTVRATRWGRAARAGALDVSIVIPVFNNLELTLECLSSLAEHETALRFEAVVVDDGSSDRTPDALARLPGVRVVSSRVNRGFGAACNSGAEVAGGEVLVFLNNDTVVEPGWLDTLRETLDVWPRVGIVGSKLVTPDGVLQECGGLVFRDGSAHNFGRGEDPDDPRYCYTREADFVSGASLMIRRELFRELGGFDDRYAPAYYEDVDLCFGVRARGLAVVVSPHSRVVHREGATAGRDVGAGVKRYQAINAIKFRERWASALGVLPEPPPGPLDLPPAVGARVLVIDCWIPRPDQDAGSLRMAAILRVLVELGCHVTLVAEDMGYVERYAHAFETRGVEVLRRPHCASVEDHLELRGAVYDLVVISRRGVMLSCLDAVERHCPQALVVFDTVDLHFVREAREASLNREIDWTEASATAEELALAERVDVTIVCSSWERELLADLAPGCDVRVLPTIHEVAPQNRPFAAREGMIFVGSFGHPPNADAVQFLASEVLPLLGEDHPVVHIVGARPPDAVRALDSDRFRVHGFVPEIEPLFAACRLSVAPLRFGAGVKGKIGQSLGLGLPCVTTPVGAEGMHMEDGRNGLVAADAAGLAERITRLHNDPELWARLRRAGLETIDAHFSPTMARRVLGDLVAKAAGRGAADGRG